jgi:hypothetical protein
MENPQSNRTSSGAGDSSISREKPAGSRRELSGVFHIERHDIGYTQISNAALEDPNLSWKARGLLAYLLSRPPDWTARTWHLVSQGPDGLRAVRSAIKELERFGYFKRQRFFGEKGRFQWVTAVFESPELAKRATEQEPALYADPASPSVRFASMDNAPMQNASMQDAPMQNVSVNKTESPRTELPNTESATTESARTAASALLLASAEPLITDAQREMLQIAANGGISKKTALRLIREHPDHTPDRWERIRVESAKGDNPPALMTHMIRDDDDPRPDLLPAEMPEHEQETAAAEIQRVAESNAAYRRDLSQLESMTDEKLSAWVTFVTDQLPADHTLRKPWGNLSLQEIRSGQSPTILGSILAAVRYAAQAGWGPLDPDFLLIRRLTHEQISLAALTWWKWPQCPRNLRNVFSIVADDPERLRSGGCPSIRRHIAEHARRSGFAARAPDTPDPYPANAEIMFTELTPEELQEFSPKAVGRLPECVRSRVSWDKNNLTFRAEVARLFMEQLNEP